jgi:hypothetical protein
MEIERARAFWWQRQGLGAPISRSVTTVLGDTGWLRTLAGADVYIAARARVPGMTRAQLDKAVAGSELRVMPAVRGCIYLVPAGAIGDLMALNAESWRASATKDLAKIGKSLRDVEKLVPSVLAAIGDGALTTDAIRKAVDVPSFGEAGKKIGVSSPLPLALRLLELERRIERTLEGGRLDSDRYLWRATTAPKPAKDGDRVARLGNIVNQFLSWAGPATLAQLAAWTGLAQRDLAPALAQLGAESIAIDGLGEAWLRRGDRAAVERAPAAKGIALLAFEDNYLVNHGGLAAVTEARHLAAKIDPWGGTSARTVGESKHVLSRTIVIDGLVAGLWEVDPRARGAVWFAFDPPSAAIARELDDRTHELATFLLDELGHARSFSLDTMDDVQERADRIGKLRSGGKKPKAIAAKRAAKAKPKPAAKKRRR